MAKYSTKQKAGFVVSFISLVLGLLQLIAAHMFSTAVSCRDYQNCTSTSTLSHYSNPACYTVIWWIDVIGNSCATSAAVLQIIVAARFATKAKCNASDFRSTSFMVFGFIGISFLLLQFGEADVFAAILRESKLPGATATATKIEFLMVMTGVNFVFALCAATFFGLKPPKPKPQAQPPSPADNDRGSVV